MYSFAYKLLPCRARVLAPKHALFHARPRSLGAAATRTHGRVYAVAPVERYGHLPIWWKPACTVLSIWSRKARDLAGRALGVEPPSTRRSLSKLISPVLLLTYSILRATLASAIHFPRRPSNIKTAFGATATVRKTLRELSRALPVPVVLCSSISLGRAIASRRTLEFQRSRMGNGRLPLQCDATKQ